MPDVTVLRRLRGPHGLSILPLASCASSSVSEDCASTLEQYGSLSADDCQSCFSSMDADAGFDITSPDQQEFLLNVSTEARWRADLKVRPSVLTWIKVFRKRHRADSQMHRTPQRLFSKQFSIICGMRTAEPTSLETFSERGCSSRSTGWARHQQAVSSLFETSG